MMAASTATSSSGPSRLASPLTPPPLYALVTPELHRCSAIGLEEALNEAWADEEAASRRKQQHTGTSSNHGGADSSSHRQDRSGDSNEGSSRHYPHRSQTGGYPIAPSVSPPLPDSSLLPPLLAFLQSLSLRTLVYLSPSLLPCALLKLAHQLDLNLVQWDLTGPKVWRARSTADEGEIRTLRRFAAAASNSRRGKGSRAKKCEGDYVGGRADETLMVLSLISLVLTASTSPALVCDPSGLAQTSLVVGCLRRMMRRSFASICVEYRAFAASAPVSAARTTPGQLPSTASALRFIEMFPLEEVQLPDTWDEMVPWAADGLRAMQKVLQARDDSEGQRDPPPDNVPAG